MAMTQRATGSNTRKRLLRPPDDIGEDALRLGGIDELVAGGVAEVAEVDVGSGVRRLDGQAVADRDLPHRLARLEDGKGAVQSLGVEDLVHVPQAALAP